MQVKKQQLELDMEEQTGFKLGKEYIKTVYCHLAFEDNVCCGFVIYSFDYVEVGSFYSCFLESFDHKWMLNFVILSYICLKEMLIQEHIDIRVDSMWLPFPCYQSPRWR